ncbi:MAG: hypothetical protein AB1847_11300 [bacterium]
MKEKVIIFSMIAAMIMVITVTGSNSAFAVDWRFPVGLTYISNFQDIADLHENNLEAEGNVTTSTDAVPVGLAFNPYVEFDFGLGIGIGVGPLMMVLGDTEFINVPLKFDVRYAIPQLSVSPYVRAGVSYNAASGDYVESSTPGLFLAGGVEFLRNKVVGFGLELSYDSSEIEFEKYTASSYYYGYTSEPEKIKPGEFTISLYAVF